MNRIIAVIMMALLAATIATAAQGQEMVAGKAGTTILSRAAAAETEALTTANARHVALLPGLIAEALENNPEIQAAYQEREAARQQGRGSD